jgi:hypothetical protein
MRVFISWSGQQSRAVAAALAGWLPLVIQSVSPYFSPDIEKGSRWFIDISKALADISYGILCVTGQNVREPWLNFEAGALAKSLDESRVVPFLSGIRPSDVTGPLAHFQATVAERDDVYRLVCGINKLSGTSAITDEQLAKTFEVFWPQLQEALDRIGREASESGEPSPVARNADEVMREILELTRSTANTVERIVQTEPSLTPPDESAVQESWHRTLNSLNPKTRAYFKEAKAILVDNDRLLLLFPYQFHLKMASDRVEEVMPILREWLGPAIRVDLRLLDSAM